MKKTLIKQSNEIAKETADCWEAQKNSLQATIDLYTALGLSGLDGNDLQRMFTDTTSFLFDKLTNNEEAHLVIGTGDNKTHLPINKEHAIDILQKPAGYDALLTSIKKIADSCVLGVGRERYGAYHINQVAEYFCIGDGYQVNFTEKTNGIINEAGKEYISSDRANKLFDFYKAFEQSFFETGAADVCDFRQLSLDQLLENILTKVDYKNKKVGLNTDYFISLDRTLSDFENQ